MVSYTLSGVGHLILNAVNSIILVTFTICLAL